MSDNKKFNRRTLLAVFILAVTSLIIISYKRILTLLGFYSQEKDENSISDTFVLACTKSELEHLRYKKVVANENAAVVILTSKKEIKAYSLRCTHKGCGLKIKIDNELYFDCSCHGSKFNESGNALNGPAKNPLQQRLIKIEQDSIYIKML